MNRRDAEAQRRNKSEKGFGFDVEQNRLLEDREMSVNALAKTLEISQSSLSEMLNGRREWSKQAIIRISDYFGLQPGLFLR